MIGFFGKILIFFGAILILIGLIFSLAEKIPYIGKLPGDFYIRRDNFIFYLPLGTGLLISAIISIILYLISKFWK